MLDINKIISQNFNDNIIYIQDKHPKIFEKLSALDSAIKQGHYQDKYELVYENDGFDVFESSTKTYLYTKEGFAHSLVCANSINMEINNNTFEGFVRHQFSEDEIYKLQKSKKLSDYKKYVADIIFYINQNSAPHKELLELPKFIFFGVGLGLHIKTIHEKIASQIYFIIEDDLELFRLSLFTTNYKELAKEATLIFSVFEDRDEFMASSALFLDTKSYYNHYLKFFHLLSHNEEKIENFQMAVTSQPHIRFLFNNSMLQYTQAITNIQDNTQILTKMTKLPTALQQLPFLVLASGPSLEKNMAWLKKNHQNYITVSVSSSLQHLEKEGIQADIILHIDPFEWGIDSFKRLDSMEYVKKSISLFGASTPQNIISLADPKKLFLFETGTNYKQESLKLSTPCIGSMALKILLVFQVKNIYLLGLDLAIDPESGRTHISSHQSSQLLTTETLSKETLAFDKSLLEVNGNFLKTVQTTPSYYSSIYTIEYFMTRLKKEFQNIYNLSNGAKFSYTIPTIAEKIKYNSLTITKKQKTDLNNFFTTSISKEIFEYQDRLKHANKQLELTHTFNIDNITKGDELIPFIYDTFTLEYDIDKYELSLVIDDYLHYISSYIYDFFNTTQKINIPQSLQKFTSLLTKQLQELIEYYIITLEENSCKK